MVDLNTAKKAALLELIHFGDRPRKCQFCEDFKEKLCKGYLFSDITDCMVDKAVSGEAMIEFYGFNGKK